MDRKWWKEGVVYQIYPRSFYDSNGDGIGDLRGIIEKLDYLRTLGVDIVWLSPVYKSPNDDNGYDVSDYRDIMDEFGTMADMDELISRAHALGIRLVMDLVVNHTSDEHPWFVESRSSRDSRYRDYYIWRPGRRGGPPNNWGSHFGGSAWKYDAATGEYYLHLFSEKQPDLNWENPRVREEVYDMMRWWLDRGIDGFRMDCINMLSKVPGLPDGTVRRGREYANGRIFYQNGPRIHEYLREMNERVLSRYDVMTVGETPGVTPEIAAEYVAEDRRELNMVFHFELMEMDHEPDDKWRPRRWRLTELKSIFGKWYEGLKDKGWNSLFMSNHDQPRQVSRFGDDGRYRVESAKMLATLLHTLPGTPFVYQGEEIGMTNVPFTSIADFRDIETLNVFREKRREGVPEDEIMAAIRRMSRDNARTPMQWDARVNAGFSTGTPWIRVNPNYERINVARDLNDPGSILHYYRKLIRLRKENPAIVHGDYRPLLEDDERIFAYLRTLGGDRFLVILNFFRDPAMFALPDEIACGSKEVLIANYEPRSQDDLARLELRPYEARVYRLS